MMPTRRRTRAQAKNAYITGQRELNAVHNELDRAAAIDAATRTAQQRQARHETQRTDSLPEAQWAARQDAVDDLLESLICPPGHQPDYSDDPPPF